jgi:hypothetical protein
MSLESKLNLNAKQEYIEEEERKIKEMIFLRQFNYNFDKYKGEVNTKLYEKDKEEIDMLNEIGQPKILYNNFPLILGIIFIIFGIIFILITDTTDKVNVYYQTPVTEFKKNN